MNLSDIMKTYLESLLERNLSPLHMRTVQSRLSQFICPSEEFPTDRRFKPVGQITALELHEHFQILEEGGRSDGTMAGHASTHRAFWAWIAERGLRDNSPATKLRRYSYSPKRRRAAPVASVEAISTCLPGFVAAGGYAGRDVRDALAVSLALDSGCRIGEIRSLRRRDMENALSTGDMSANGRMRYTVVGHGKTGDQVLTFFNESADLYRLWQLTNPHPNAEFVFVSTKNGRLLRRETMGRCFTKVCEYAKVPTIRSHAIRKRNASDLQATFRDPELTRQYLGHTSINTTMKHYNDVDRDRVGEAAAVMASARRGDPLDMLFRPKPRS
ncbi:MAG: tyrosine-type recombinase/integrase [Chloroflexi bacterium]|nr:tyrosine-type recombinase/integrase [Chloroflexota bacterium]